MCLIESIPTLTFCSQETSSTCRSKPGFVIILYFKQYILLCEIALVITNLQCFRFLLVCPRFKCAFTGWWQFLSWSCNTWKRLRPYVFSSLLFLCQCYIMTFVAQKSYCMYSLCSEWKLLRFYQLSTLFLKIPFFGSWICHSVHYHGSRFWNFQQSLGEQGNANILWYFIRHGLNNHSPTWLCQSD